MSATGLRICEYNLENLFISMEYYRGEDLRRLSELDWQAVALPQLRRKQKPLVKIQGVAQAIRDIDADILMLIEVGGRDSLENLNRHFLGDRYIPFFLEGNSRRGIDLGFLVKRAAPYRAEALSNRKFPVEVHTNSGKYTSVFSRDAAELRLYDGDRLVLILLLAHLKSKLSTPADIQGKDVRTAEAIALAGLYRRLRHDFPGVPLVVGGDFNSDLSSLELEILQRTDLRDFHDCIGTPADERYTLIYFDFSENPHPLTLDYLLVSPELERRIVKASSYTYRYKGFYELPVGQPTSYRERNQLPSDHYPLVLSLALP